MCLILEGQNKSERFSAQVGPAVEFFGADFFGEVTSNPFGVDRNKKLDVAKATSKPQRVEVQPS